MSLTLDVATTFRDVPRACDALIADDDVTKSQITG
jgi:hypothetical protein